MNDAALDNAVYWFMCERSAQMGEAYTRQMHKDAERDDPDYIDDIRKQIKCAIQAYEGAKP